MYYYSYPNPFYLDYYDYLRPYPQIAPFMDSGALQQQQQQGPQAIVDSSVLQPQPPWQPQPTWPPVPTGGGCKFKWATFRLKDGRTINMYVTFIGPKSVAGTVWVPGSGWKQIGLDLDEILESQC